MTHKLYLSSLRKYFIRVAIEKSQLIFGRHPVMDALKGGRTIDKIYLQRGIRGEFEKEVRQLSKAHRIELKVVPKERLSKWTTKNHQGIVAIASLLPYYQIEDVLPTIYEKGETPLFLLLDGVTDVRNVGAIARSAVCCGVHALIMPQKNNAQLNAEAIKTSAGALQHLTICRPLSLMNTLDFLHQNGIQTLASSLEAMISLPKLDLTSPSAIIMGSEDKGVSAAVLKRTTQQFIIPQTDLTNSFNVSVASGIILYEAMRQRLTV
ncbi:MAG: 23S rRNA (guanosine(2251)-2'-O)-methyltransferase RlmB [Bacteroidota bacterium]